MADQSDLDRYREHWKEEMEGAFVYRALAQVTTPEQGSVYLELAEAEERHARHWGQKMADLGHPPEPFRPGVRPRLLAWVARRFGARAVIPLMQADEVRAQAPIADAPPGMAADERLHERVLSAMGTPVGPSISRRESWHRNSSGGALRAAVFGVNDGLVSNLALLLGVAGAGPGRRVILLVGISGLLAGAFSMAAGEYVSMRAQREVYEREIALEAYELAEMPEEEAAELALIYRAKGIPPEEAAVLAERLIADPETALDTLVREELGLNPADLGSPWTAAASSFVAFALGAFFPVLPFLFGSGTAATLASVTVSGAALFAVGAVLTLFTARPLVRSGMRMLIIGAAAGGLTFLIGTLIGVGV